MRNEEKERLNKQTEKRYLWIRFKNGCKSLKHSKARQYALMAFYVLIILIWIFIKDRFSLENVELVSPVFVALSKMSFPITLIAGTVVILILFGTPSRYETIWIAGYAAEPIRCFLKSYWTALLRQSRYQKTLRGGSCCTTAPYFKPIS